MATGSIEQPAVFRNNDLPGVMMGSAAQRLIHLYGVKPGTRAVILTANDDGYGVALDLVEAGIARRGGRRSARQPAADRDVRAVAADAVCRSCAGHAVTEALAARHKHACVGVAGRAGSSAKGNSAVADAGLRLRSGAACRSGYTPAAQLLHHAGAKFAYDHASQHVPAGCILPAHVFAAGSVNGTFQPRCRLADGRRAGWAAAKDAGFAVGAEPAARRRPRGREPDPSLADLPACEGQGLRRFRRGSQSTRT